MVEDGRLPDRRVVAEDGTRLGCLRFNGSDVESVCDGWNLEKDFEKALRLGRGIEVGDLKEIGGA